MFKKIISITISILLFTILCGCYSNDNDNNKNDSNSKSDNAAIFSPDNISTTGKTIIGKELEYISSCSEGLMFAKILNDDSIIYCVNKNGDVIFELSTEKVNKNTMDDAVFMGDYAFVRAKTDPKKDSSSITAICNKKGNIILPSDVGVTEFLGPNEILKSGYILATKVEANKSKLGVLNTSFEWVVPLSESLYNEFSNSLSDSHKQNFVINECFYSVKLAKSLNLKTGEIKSVELKNVTPSSKWGTPKSCDGYYRIENNMVVVNDGKYVDLADDVILAAGFANGTAPILYKNGDKYFVTLINENGSHIFEPVQITYAPNSFKFATDGNYLVYTEKSLLVCRDLNGKKIGEFDLQKFDDRYLTINDGVITVSNSNKALCFDAHLNKLF